MSDEDPQSEVVEAAPEPEHAGTATSETEHSVAEHFGGGHSHQPEAAASKKHRMASLKKPLLWGAVIVVVLLNVGMGGLSTRFFLKHRHDSVAAEALKKSTSKVVTATDSNKSGSLEATKTVAPLASQHYKSDALGIEFDYPGDWYIASSYDDKSIKLNSATFDLVTTGGKKYQAVIRMTIDYHGSFLLSVNDPVTRESEKLVYANPTSQQRKETNLTFLRDSDTPATAGSFHDVFVSGNQVFHVGETLASHDVSKVHPYISFSLEDTKCLEGCTTSLLIPVNDDAWTNNTEIGKAKTLIGSLRLF